MKSRLTVFLVPALILVASAATAGSKDAEASNLSEEFQALETRLLEVRRDGETEALRQLISSDFGYYQAFNQSSIRGTGAAQWQQGDPAPYHLESFEIHESHARWVGDQVVLSATRATLNGETEHLLTSTWLQAEDGAWKLTAQVAVELGSKGPENHSDSQAEDDLDRAARRAKLAERLGLELTEGQSVREALRERMENGDLDHQALRKRMESHSVDREAWRAQRDARRQRLEASGSDGDS